MPPEQQVCSLALAQKLQDLGEKQDSYFCYIKYKCKEKAEICHMLGNTELKLSCSCGEVEILASAFSVTELGERLPVTIQIDGENYWFVCTKTTFKYRCGYEYEKTDGRRGWGRFNDSTSHAIGVADTLADAMAKMLIHLIENGLVILEK